MTKDTLRTKDSRDMKRQFEGKLEEIREESAIKIKELREQIKTFNIKIDALKSTVKSDV